MKPTLAGSSCSGHMAWPNVPTAPLGLCLGSSLDTNHMVQPCLLAAACVPRGLWQAVLAAARLLRSTLSTAGCVLEASQFAEVKTIHRDIVEWQKWPVLHLYTDSWMLTNAL